MKTINSAQILWTGEKDISLRNEITNINIANVNKTWAMYHVNNYNWLREELNEEEKIKFEYFCSEVNSRNIIESSRKGWSDQFIKSLSSYACLLAGRFFSHCPYSNNNKRISSSRSLFSGPMILYEFFSHNEKPFYLLHCLRTTLGIEGFYLPEEDLILSFNKAKWVQQHLSDGVKNYLLDNPKKPSLSIEFENTTAKKNFSLITLNQNNFGHAYWNDISGIESLIESGLHNEIEEIIAGPYRFFEIDEIFPEIPKKKITKVSCEEEISNKLQDENVLITKFTDFYLKEKTINRLKKKATDKKSSFKNREFLKPQIDEVYLWFCIRGKSSRRIIWGSQVNGIAYLINEVCQRYGKINVIFDGWTSGENVTDKDLKMINEENAVIESIVKSVSREIDIINLVGTNIYEKVYFSRFITAYFCPFGSSLTIPSWIADKPGVSHENPGFFKHIAILYEKGFRENMQNTCITIPEDSFYLGSDSYEFDLGWAKLKLLDIIAQKKTHNTYTNSPLNFKEIAPIKKKLVIIGNCQSLPLHKILSNLSPFKNYFDIRYFPPVHIASTKEVAELHSLLEKEPCLLITQRIQDTYRENIGLGTNYLNSIVNEKSSIITWPNMHWAGYHPDLFEFKKINHQKILGEFDYHNILILWAYHSGLSIDECVDVLISKDFVCDFEKNAMNCTQSLKTRERDLQISVSDYIEEHFRDNRLFYTYNHPTNKVILHLAKKILAYLEINAQIDNTKHTPLMDGTFYQIHPSIYASLKLKFSWSDQNKIRGDFFSIFELVQRYYSFYDNKIEFISHNMALIKNQLMIFGK